MSKSEHPTPHDYYFRNALQNESVAREFFQQCLPKEILAITNLNLLRLHETNLFSKYMERRTVDVLYETLINKQEGYLYILAEHQSSPDKYMALRILRYKTDIMCRHIEQYGKDKLPLIYGLIFYSGTKNYNYSTDLFDLFDESQRDLAKQFLIEPCNLVQSRLISDEALRGMPRANLLIQIMNNVRSADKITHTLNQLEGTIRRLEVEGEENLVYTTYSYIYEASDLSLDDFEKAASKIATPDTREKIMTLAQKVRKEAFEQGIIAGAAKAAVEGEQIGLSKGRAECRRILAKNLLRDGQPKEKVLEWTGLTLQELEELE